MVICGERPPVGEKMKKKNIPRAQKLDSMATDIALFIFQETWTDEIDVQKHLNNALKSLQQARAKMKDKEVETSGESGCRKPRFGRR